MNKKNIMIIAGGTAGHVYPALELAREFIKRGQNIIFLTDQRMYSRVLSEMKNNSSIKVFSLSGKGFIKNNFIYNMKSIFLLVCCLFESFYRVIMNKPNVVFGFGGYITVAPVIVCKLIGIPIILHEGNKVIGRANKLLLNKIHKFTYFFENIEGVIHQNNFVNIGMPVREEIEKLNKSKYSISINKPINILITGGSLGAQDMALFIAKALCAFSKNDKNKINIIQQVRIENIRFVKKLYVNAGINFKIMEFIENYPKILKWSHIVICRCGSGTLSENLVSGRPSIMLPLKYSADGHQFKNAKCIENIGAGWIINDKELNNESLLVEKLKKIIFNNNGLLIASQNAKKHITIGASKRLADLASNILN